MYKEYFKVHTTSKGYVCSLPDNVVGQVFKALIMYAEKGECKPMEDVAANGLFLQLKAGVDEVTSERLYTSGLCNVRLEECYRQLSNNRQWLETLTMNIRSGVAASFRMEDVQAYLKRFFQKLENEGETEKAPKDAMAHFARWLSLELRNNPQRNTNNQVADERKQKYQERKKQYQERESYAVTPLQMQRIRMLAKNGDARAQGIMNGTLRLTAKEIGEWLMQHEI